ncbi:MAG TPA: enoyl-CoA hydratase-related protein, partial [Conexibacter sp.]|nr:enoyl-CoA hydratase-related protein [Conexibacter sp.]
MSESTMIRWDQDEDGIVVLTLDEPGAKVNTMNAAYRAAMGATVDRLEAERDGIAGVVVASGKSSFFAGGNLNELIAVTTDGLDEFAEVMRTLRAQLRRLETLGKPVVAAINGVALGGGLEICLACHHRIVVDDPKAQLGCPEVTFGLLPGAGGVTRSVRLLGVVPALQHVLLRGQRHQPAAAKELGLVDEIVATREELIPAAKQWIKAKGGRDPVQQPWDGPGYAMPGGRPDDAALAGHVLALPPTLRKQLKGANYPAPHHIMAAAVEGAQVDFDTAIEIESRYFLDLITGQVAKNMIQGHFFDMQRVSGDRGRAADAERFASRKLVVLGAGMMGAAITYVCAKAGIEVVLKDVSQEAADRGKGYSEKLVGKGVERGRTTQEKGDALLARI